ncbi:DUF6258 family protein [Kiloniella sp.]|uniref:DUF6258 family protein n=1 Tax=Kiloniella sp. TaxID=1938587 RepID=UPI003B01F650
MLKKANMNPADFVKSIYLGDRGCKKITYDICLDEFTIQVDTISRIRSESGEWNFYVAEDIIDGLIVFKGVHKVLFDPSGYPPNDYINYLKIDNDEEGEYCFTLSIGYVSPDDPGVNYEIILKVFSKGICLRDPLTPNHDITV